jgi:pentatricopeptide repeat protein
MNLVKWGRHGQVLRDEERDGNVGDDGVSAVGDEGDTDGFVGSGEDIGGYGVPPELDPAKFYRMRALQDEASNEDPGIGAIPGGVGSIGDRPARADSPAFAPGPARFSDEKRVELEAGEVARNAEQLFQLLARPGNYGDDTEFVEKTDYSSADTFIEAASQPGSTISDADLHYTLRAFAKRGSLQDALDVFEFWRGRKHHRGSELRDPAAWTSVISAYFHASDVEVVRFVQKQQDQPEREQLLLEGARHELRTKTVSELRGELRRRSMNISGPKAELVVRLSEGVPSTRRRITDLALAEAGEQLVPSSSMAEIQRLGKFPSFVLEGRARIASSASTLVDEMERVGVSLDMWGYSSLVSLYGRAKDFDGAMKLMKQISDAELVPDHVLFGSLIQAAARAGEYERAWKLFSRLRHDDAMEPDEVTYNHMIWVCAKQDRAEKAQNLVDEMKQLGLRPLDVTYNTLLHAYALRRDLYADAWKVVEEMKRDGLVPDPYTLHTIMHAAARVGDVHSVEKLADTLLDVAPTILRDDLRPGHENASAPTPNKDMAKPRLFSIILTAYANNTKMIREHGCYNIDKAEEWFHRMREEFNVPPNIHTANALLMNYAAAGRLRRLESRWSDMFGEHGNWIAPMNEQIRAAARQQAAALGPPTDNLGRVIEAEPETTALSLDVEPRPDYLSREPATQRRVRYFLEEALEAAPEDPSPAVQQIDSLFGESQEEKEEKRRGRTAAVSALDDRDQDVLLQTLAELEAEAENLLVKATPQPTPLPATEVLTPGVAAYTSLMWAYGSAKRVVAAKTTFETMQGAGTEPDESAYKTLLFAYNKAGYLNSAIETVRIITQEHKWTLTIEDVQSLLDRLRPYPRLELQVRQMCGLVKPDLPKIGKRYLKNMRDKPEAKWAAHNSWKARNPDLHSQGYLRRKARRAEAMKTKRERPHPGIFRP